MPLVTSGFDAIAFAIALFFNRSGGIGPIIPYRLRSGTK